jgi:hypothetical protein
VGQALSEVIRDAIHEGLMDSCPENRPFLILREAGVVAEIRRALRVSLAGKLNGHPHQCRANIRSLAKTPRYEWKGMSNDGNAASVWVDRVQLEMKLVSDEYFNGRFDSHLKVSDGDADGRADVVVLAPDGVRLACENNGPGDVVALVPASAVSACIEVKASPSVDPGQVKLFSDDIDSLLKFLEMGGESSAGESPCAFFVLVDKSSKWFGNWVPSQDLADRCVQWTAVDCLSDLLSGPGDGKTSRDARTSIRKQKIRLTSKRPEGHKFVEVIRLEAKSQPLFATRKRP